MYILYFYYLLNIKSIHYIYNNQFYSIFNIYNYIIFIYKFIMFKLLSNITPILIEQDHLSFLLSNSVKVTI